MATLADSLHSSAARPVALRRRPDLVARRQRYHGCSHTVVKEPLGLNYFRFKEEEYAILQMLDGRTSLEQIKERFEQQFPPQKITLEELQQFIASLHQSGLVVSPAAGQGRQLKKRRDERRRKELIAACSNVLCIRFRGIDPERILSAVYPFVRWMFSPLVVVLCCLMGLSALALVVVQFDVFYSRLPAFHQFFTLYNAFWLLVAMAAAKILHEFGHGLSCKHFGGECHEMGVMILVLTPCLYCNVSDSWLLPSKWRRAAIGAAGMYVELIIASLATFTWWFSERGFLNHICLNLMFVCSVSTLLFNLNPLLRFDGYYILSDLTEIPNLRQKAGAVLLRWLGWVCLGIRPQPDPFLPQRRRVFFALYAVAAAVYRWVVVLSILWFLSKVFEPYRLQIVGQLIAATALYGLIVIPLWRVVRFFWVPGRVEKVSKPRMAVSLGLLAGVVAAVVFVPLPYRVICPLEVKPRGATPVYVEVPGRLQSIGARPGDEVPAGATLARLDNVDVELSLAELAGQRDLHAARLTSLHRARFNDPELGARIPHVEKLLESLEQQWQERKTQQQRLTLTAARAGTVLPPPAVPAKEPGEGRLPLWSGTPLEPENVGCHLEVGTLFCLLGDPGDLEAVLVVDQADIEFVREGDEVEMKLEEFPGETFPGVIEEIARSDLKSSPRQLSNKAGGELATQTDEQGVERPQSTSYQARVRLEDPRGLIHLGTKGRAKIHAGYRTLAQRLHRYLSQTFRFK